MCMLLYLGKSLWCAWPCVVDMVTGHYSAHPFFLFFGWHDHEMAMKLVKAQSLPSGLWCPCVAQTQVVRLISPHSWPALHFLPSQLLPWGDLPCQHAMASGRVWKHLLNLLPNLYVDISFFYKIAQGHWKLTSESFMKGPLWLLHSPVFSVSVERKTTCS